MTAETKLPEPLLSICIPTLNRAHFLVDMLASLRPEVTALGPAVEVVVCDNASSDNTEQVLRANEDWIRWGQNEETVSFPENMMRVVCDHARGQFVWLVGDDDLVIRGAITRIVNSIRAHPDIAYHYLNFGWLQISKRQRIIREFDSTLPEDSSHADKLQFDQLDMLILPRIEDLAFLPGGNPSAMFSIMMCFAAHRELFITSRAYLRQFESTDGSTNALYDIFAHPMVTVPPMAGRPVVYIGQPCLLQGLGSQHWHTLVYEYKNMILGNYQLFSWLEDTAFAKDAMEKLWESFYNMAGRLFFRMLNSSAGNAGLEIVLEKVIPNICTQTTFWQAIQTEAQNTFQRDAEARFLTRLLEPLLMLAPESRVGLWGVQGRGSLAVEISEPLRRRLVWATDLNPDLQGGFLKGTELEIASPESLSETNLDILVVGTNPDLVAQAISQATSLLTSDVTIVSLNGLGTAKPPSRD